jgi:microcystin-dependent protein
MLSLIGTIMPYAALPDSIKEDWMICNGQELDSFTYDELYNVIGTTYGGRDDRYFNLPDLQGRMPIGKGQGPDLPAYRLGERGGADTVVLQEANLPAHTHAVTSARVAVSAGTDQKSPSGKFMGVTAEVIDKPYIAGGAVAKMGGNATATSSAGGSKAIPIQNVNLATTYCICIKGIFPYPGND